MIERILREIFTVNLGVKKHERVLVFTDRVSATEEVDEADRPRRAMLRSLALLAAETGTLFSKTVIHHEYPATGSHGAEPPRKLWELAFGKKPVEHLQREQIFRPLLKKSASDTLLQKAEQIIAQYKRQAVDCVVALSNFSTSHTRFRDFLTRVCGCRYASMPLFDASMLEGAMNVDWKALARTTKTLAGIVNKAAHIDIKTPNGTGLTLSKKGRKAIPDTGILTRPGAFGNLPAGEVYLAPVEGTATGRLVLEWAPTRQLGSPVTLIIQQGVVVDISGKDTFASLLRTKLAERTENRNIAELGIGTNRAAKRPDNILESEKILGTIHIALGDNSSFGGTVKTPFHQDFVFFRPTVTLISRDGSRKEILKNGRMVFASFSRQQEMAEK
ncbi:MAG: aminopeptidase [Nitrospirota bacterium]